MNIHNDSDMDVLNLDNCNASQNSRVSNDSFVSFTLEVNDCEIPHINNNTEMLSLDLYGPKEVKKNPKYQNFIKIHSEYYYMSIARKPQMNQENPVNSLRSPNQAFSPRFANHKMALRSAQDAEKKR